MHNLFKQQLPNGVESLSLPSLGCMTVGVHQTLVPVGYFRLEPHVLASSSSGWYCHEITGRNQNFYFNQFWPLIQKTDKVILLRPRHFAQHGLLWMLVATCCSSFIFLTSEDFTAELDFSCLRSFSSERSRVAYQ